MTYKRVYQALGYCVLGVLVVNLHQVVFAVKQDLTLTEYIQEAFDRCVGEGLTRDCIARFATEVLQQASLVQALTALENVEKNGSDMPIAYLQCHHLTHYLAQTAYRQGATVDEIYQQCTPVCGGGCYHGALEAYFSENYPPNVYQDENVLVGAANRVCGDLDSYDLPGLYIQCIHGLGHGLMYATDNEVPQALQVCDKLGPFADKRVCYNAVFMEDILGAAGYSVHPSKYIGQTNDPFGMCESYDERYRSSCYTSITFYKDLFSPFDQAGVVGVCEQVPEEYQRACFFNYGAIKALRTLNSSKIKFGCDYVKDAGYRNECVKGALQGLTSRYGSITAPAVEFCSVVRSENKESCWSQLGNSLSIWSKGKTDALVFCDSLPNVEEQDWCKAGVEDGYKIPVI